MRLIDRIIRDFGPEDREHYAVVQWCDALGLDVFHVPNSTWTKSIMVRTRNSLLGVRAGIPDLWVILPDIGLVVIEMKHEKRKRSAGGTNYATPAQREWIRKLNSCPGVAAHVCFGKDEAITLIKGYLQSVPKPSPAVPATTSDLF